MREREPILLKRVTPELHAYMTLWVVSTYTLGGYAIATKAWDQSQFVDR